MTRNGILAYRLREVLLDGKWIANTNYKDQLSLVSWEQATQKIYNLNTIAALTFHINYYLVGLFYAFDKGLLEISDQYSFAVQEIQSEDDWDILVSGFLDNSKKFADRVERMEDHLLDEPFVEAKYGSNLRNIGGVIEHSYYHLGQIVLIRKMLRQYQA